jgi:hypothetical protein
MVCEERDIGYIYYGPIEFPNRVYIIHREVDMVALPLTL